MKTYKVNEIFYSIQGEGSWVGTPMVFVRFSGCNLKCTFCDTPHEEGTEMYGEQILKSIFKACSRAGMETLGVPVCFTGGEPCLQLDVDLLRQVDCCGFPSHLETNGTVPIPHPEKFQCITISPKQNRPDPEMISSCLGFITTKELKIIWNDTYPDETRESILYWEPYFDDDKKFIQPITYPDGTVGLDRALDFVKSHRGWRISVQLHRMLGLR